MNSLSTGYMLKLLPKLIIIKQLFQLSLKRNFLLPFYRLELKVLKGGGSPVKSWKQFSHDYTHRSNQCWIELNISKKYFIHKNWKINIFNIFTCLMKNFRSSNSKTLFNALYECIYNIKTKRKHKTCYTPLKVSMNYELYRSVSKRVSLIFIWVSYFRTSL